MPLQNRVDPFGELWAIPERGLLFGNRGGRFHGDDRTLGDRRWASRSWICCVLSFKGRHRSVWGKGYTELFFADEVTALAAGHRPCFECRRADAEAFARLWPGAPQGGRASASAMDRALHNERLGGRGKRVEVRSLADVPDGAMIAFEDAPRQAYGVLEDKLLMWMPHGYVHAMDRPKDTRVHVLTPPSTLAVLAAGYAPQWHPSASQW